ncbi:hypothetical protein Plhal710r2_c006g0026951 [Plasmopara halstedii]
MRTRCVDLLRRTWSAKMLLTHALFLAFFAFVEVKCGNLLSERLQLCCCVKLHIQMHEGRNVFGRGATKRTMRYRRYSGSTFDLSRLRMQRKFLQLWHEDGKKPQKFSVDVNDEDVERFQKAVFTAVSHSLPATVIAADLTVYANRSTFEMKRPLNPEFGIGAFGLSQSDALIVVAPYSRDENGGSPWNMLAGTIWCFVFVLEVILAIISASFGQNPLVDRGVKTAHVVSGIFFVFSIILIIPGSGNACKCMEYLYNRHCRRTKFHDLELSDLESPDPEPPDRKSPDLDTRNPQHQKLW